MRLVRIVNFVVFGQMPIIAVVKKDDLTVSPEELISTWKQKDATTLIIADEMEIADSATDDEVGEAMMHRLTERLQLEGNMAAVFAWATAHFAKKAATTGLSMVSDSPLTVEELELVLKQLAVHPEYAGHTVVTYSKDHKAVCLVGGNIQLGDVLM
jgi:hypothetical protein